MIIKEKDTIELNLPAGTYPGMEIVFPKQGE